jgi:hypothetical protein
MKEGKAGLNLASTHFCGSRNWGSQLVLLTEIGAALEVGSGWEALWTW